MASLPAPLLSSFFGAAAFFLLNVVSRGGMGMGDVKLVGGLGLLLGVISWRAFATGIFNAGSNIGAIITPVSLPFIVALVGWRAAFLIAGSLGLIWLVLWLRFYELPERQKRLSDDELAYIKAGDDAPAEPVKWLSLLRYRGTWAYVAGMLMTSPVWWFYLNWVPGFLHDRFGIEVPIVPFPRGPSRLVRISAQVYLDETDFERLAVAQLRCRVFAQPQADGEPLARRNGALLVLEADAPVVAIAAAVHGALRLDRDDHEPHAGRATELGGQ